MPDPSFCFAISQPVDSPHEYLHFIVLSYTSSQTECTQIFESGCEKSTF